MILISPHADWFQYLSSFQYSICSHTDTKMELFNIFPLLLLHCLRVLIQTIKQICKIQIFLSIMRKFLRNSGKSYEICLY